MTTEYISPLDTRRFGFSIGRIDDPEILRSPGFGEKIRARNIQLVISRIAAEDISAIHSLEHMGFRVMDFQTTWHLSMTQPPVPVFPNAGIRIRQGDVSDVAGLRNIAMDAFDNYGHYFADPRLDRSRCKEIYPDWVGRTLTVAGVADQVLVAESEGRLAGFLSFAIREKDATRYGEGIIGAVAEEFRGKQVFSSLVMEGIDWGKKNRLACEEHNVLATNYPVNRAFSRLGFRQVSSFVTLHYWPDR